MHKKLGGMTAWRAATAAQRDTPGLAMLCSAIKAGGSRRKGRMLAVTVVVSQVTAMRDEALLYWGWLNICEWEAVN